MPSFLEGVFELYDNIQCYFSRLFGRTDFVDCVHSVSDLRFNVQNSTFKVLVDIICTIVHWRISALFSSV